MDEKDYNSVIIQEMKNTIKNLETRIIKLETTKEKTDYQYEEIMKALEKLNDVTIPELMEEINALKEKPAKKYDNIITTAIGTIVGAIAGAIIGLVIKK